MGHLSFKIGTPLRFVHHRLPTQIKDIVRKDTFHKKDHAKCNRSKWSMKKILYNSSHISY